MRNTWFKPVARQQWHGFQPQAVGGTSKTVVEERLKAPPQTWDRATLSNRRRIHRKMFRHAGEMATWAADYKTKPGDLADGAVFSRESDSYSH